MLDVALDLVLECSDFLLRPSTCIFHTAVALRLADRTIDRDYLSFLDLLGCWLPIHHRWFLVNLQLNDGPLHSTIVPNHSPIVSATNTLQP